jgi:hypothetical protein
LATLPECLQWKLYFSADIATLNAEDVKMARYNDQVLQARVHRKALNSAFSAIMAQNSLFHFFVIDGHLHVIDLVPSCEYEQLV